MVEDIRLRELLSSGGGGGGNSEEDCVNHSVLPDSLWSHELQPTKLLCPGDSPGKNTGVLFTPVKKVRGQNGAMWNGENLIQRRTHACILRENSS